MLNLNRLWILLPALLAAACNPGAPASPSAAADPTPRISLDGAWSLQSSAGISAGGAALSQPGFDAGSWHAISVPNTVVGALVENGTYKDPYTGANLRSLPGMKDSLGKRFTLVETPEDSPYKPAWWYRTEFTPPKDVEGRSLALHFDGINYRANIWLNGQQIGSTNEVVGAFRHHEFDISHLIHPGAANALAVEVFGPTPGDLAFMWVDWNPTPADKNMGLWAPVYLTQSGPVAIRNPHVVADLALPGLEQAALTVTAEAWNTTDQPLAATIKGSIESANFSRTVKLAPHERQLIRFTPQDSSNLLIHNPRVWWPYRLGKQELYSLTVEAQVEGKPSDRARTTFGIQSITSTLTPEGFRLFSINGKPLLIRGGGWASDMMLRAKSPERLAAEFRYVKEMGLNTIRMEGKLETDEFYELADREGILLMPGWTCCDLWEMWDKWDAEDHRVAPASLHDQILRIRNHPSVLSWLNGSDYAPPPDVEQVYLDVLKKLDWQKPVISSASERNGKSTTSGMKMRGPYDYVPPNYWLTDTKYGGAFGFAGEVGPGAAVPPVESLRRMMTPAHLWPMDDVWDLHAGGDEFKDIHRFTRALEARFGKAASAEDYARKAQALTYEGERAMFEGFGRNKYRATGVIQWMLNNAWPSTIWHLYDYYLRPGGGYFGTKKAMEPLHVQYSYDDRSVVLVNDLQSPAPGITVTAEVYDGALKQLFTQTASADVGADAVVKLFTLPALPKVTSARAIDPAPVYFIRLLATGAAGTEVSRNFYWLSAHDDVPDWNKSTWYYTPTRQDADLRALTRLPATTLTVAPRFDVSGTEDRATVKVTNTGKALAFQIRLKLTDAASGEEVLPVYWADNYFELLPGETRSVSVAYPKTPNARITAEAWNAPAG